MLNDKKENEILCRAAHRLGINTNGKKIEQIKKEIREEIIERGGADIYPED